MAKKDSAKTSSLNQYAEQVEGCNGLDGLENLQRHDNEEIYDKSIALLRTYFESEEDEDAMAAPAVDQDKDQFSFGMATTAPTGGFNF